MVAEVPPCGWAVQSGELGVRLEQLVTASEDRLENDLLRVEWDGRGLLTSVWDKQAGREVLSGPGNLLQLFDDHPRNWDAWDLDVTYRDSLEDLTGLTELKVLERNGLRALVQMTREFGRSKVVQRISLDAGSRVLRFQTDVDWHEDHKLLKAAFPVGVRAREATYEIQFGHVTRPTHEETSRAKAMFEVCAQRWADLSEPRYGVALLNDCKHGYDIHGSTMRLSLLRAPTHPDPTADRGWHRFTYALMPHAGDFREAGVIEAAEDLNAPLRMVRCGLGDRASRSLISVDAAQVVVDTIKKAEDSDATIVRLYEAWGRPCRARIKTTLPAARVVICDLLERERNETSLEIDFTPFKVVTLKLEKS